MKAATDSATQADKVTRLRDQFVNTLRAADTDDKHVAEFVNALEAADLAPVDASPVGNARAPTAASATAMEAHGNSADTTSPLPDPDEHLPTVLAAMPSSELSDATRSIASALPLVHILQGADVDAGLKFGLVAAAAGFAASTNTRLGLFLISPHVHYPLHQHAALEIYAVVSGNITLQHGRHGKPCRLDPGEFSITPRNRLHSLTTGATPCLIVYAWTDQITCPSYWWEQDGAEWYRVAWQRDDNGVWRPDAREIVSDSVMREAAEN